jgi:hypothetical protein
MKGDINMNLTDRDKITLAKSFTELAIENNLITPCADPVKTANEVTAFFNTIIDTIEGNTDNQ